MHVSAVSQRVSTAGRQTVEAEANWQVPVQQADVEGSHCDPEVSLQSLPQQVELVVPASHSSPGSKIPLPHW